MNLLQEKTMQIKNDVLDIFEKGRCGHIPSSYSCAELLVALFYGNNIRYDAKNPKWDERDRFILSKGHAAIIYYAILADLGFFPKSEFDKYGKEGGMLGVHAHANVPGVEVSTGSLGCGLGVAVGMAYAAKLDKKNHLVYTVIGDGECYEGSIWESAMFAANYNLNNLVVILDHNHMCCSGFIEDYLGSEPLDQKWEAFGFDVKIVDGHDLEEIQKALKNIRCRKSKRPLCIIADTVKAKGLASVENTPFCHGYAPIRNDALEKARQELNGGM